MDGNQRPRDRRGFEIAIICALPLETNAVLCSLDDFWYGQCHYYGKHDGDHNVYNFGRIGRHSVVVVTLPGEGKVNASGAAQSLKMSFTSIKLALLVGVCGAVPFKGDGAEIVLGDVVVSEVIVELDHGRQYQHDFIRKNTILDVPGRPNEEILALLQNWKTPLLLERLREATRDHITALQHNQRANANYPGHLEDKLFQSEYIHMHHANCESCKWPDFVCEKALISSCIDLQCDESKLVARSRLRSFNQLTTEIPTPFIHFGSIGTRDTVLKSAKHRDQYAKAEDIIAFEMEGAGVWNKMNCLIIKGVCDYCDSHKNKKWQDYAAAAATSVTKALLEQYVTQQTLIREDIQHETSEMLPNLSHNSQNHLIIQGNYFSDVSAPRELFDDILDYVESLFDKETIQKFQSSNITSVKRVLKDIQDEQKKSKTLRNFRRIEKFIRATENMAAIIEESLGVTGLMCLVWGSIKLSLKKTRNHPDRLEALLSAYDRIGSELPLLQNCHELFRHDLGLQRVLAKILRNVLDALTKMTLLFSSRALKDTFKALWKDLNHQLKQTLFQINSHKRLIEDEARISINLSINPRKDTQIIRIHMQSMEQHAMEFEEKEKQRWQSMYSEVRDWFTSADIEREHSEYCHDRESYPGVGDWIMGHNKVQKWISQDPEQSSHSILWVNGSPGTGKTYLASIMIEACKQDKSCITAYFYCRANEEASNRSTAIAILRGLLFQLVRLHQDLLPYCYERMKSSDSPILSAIPEAKRILKVFCERVPHLYLIVDAIDECESNEQKKFLLDTFKDLVQGCENDIPGKLRVLLFSQQSSEIKRTLVSADVLTLAPEQNTGDIRKYCQRRTRELEKFELSDQYLKDIVELICTRADGMFLFAKLVMTNLARQPTRTRFRAESTGRNLPKGLSEVYIRIMERLKQDLSAELYEWTRLLLGWLHVSKRPLKWTEIKLASSINLDKGEDSNVVDMEDSLRDDVQELCGSLVQVLKDDRIELVHSTARKFISEQKEISLAAAECDLTLRCLRYLTLNIFSPDMRTEELHEHALRGDLAFQDYAVSTWFMHMKTMVERKEDFIEVDSQPPNSRTQLSKVCEGLGRFVDFYQDSFSLSDVSEEMLLDCNSFLPYPFYDNLVRVWGHICSEQRKDIAARNDVSISQLKETLARNRNMLENLSARVDISEHYGSRIFRCPKVLCFYFHEGFKSAQARENHVNRHQRPYHCTVENCATNGMGFVSKSALSRHLRLFHPEQCDLSDSFTPLDRGPRSNAPHVCPTCHKSFTRKNILSVHMRTHSGEKRYKCPECGKSFTWPWDMKRHTKTHDRRR